MSLQSQNAVCGHMETDDAPCNCRVKPPKCPHCGTQFMEPGHDCVTGSDYYDAMRDRRDGDLFIGGAAENYRRMQMKAQEDAAIETLNGLVGKVVPNPLGNTTPNGPECLIEQAVISTDLTVDEAMWAKWNAGRQKYGEEFVGDPIQELYAEYIDALNYFNEIERRGLLTPDLVYARLSTRRLAELVRAEARR